MILNERQYRISKTWVKKFEEALSAAQARTNQAKSKTHPKLLKARVDGINSQLEELREDLAEYEALKAGKVQRLEVTDLSELPATLIRARIAAKLSQQQLAELLGVTQQQVQRDEANLYHTASFERLEKIAKVLKVRLKGELVLG
jgi:DNA-binding XRE family transcriptional regulator